MSSDLYASQKLGHYGTASSKNDGVKWWTLKSTTGSRTPTPLCPEHDLRLTPKTPLVRNGRGGYSTGYSGDAIVLKCAEGHELGLPRKYDEEKQYIIDRIDAKTFKGMKVINLDDEAVPIAKEKLASKDDKFFVTAHLMESKRGLQVVIYAGEKGSPKKTQIFIEPDIKRLAFDQKDLHPSDVFVEVKATFQDGTKQSIESVS